MLREDDVHIVLRKFHEHREAYFRAMASLSEIQRKPGIPDYEIRDAYCEVDFHVKRLIACHRLGATIGQRFDETDIISIMAYLEIRPVFRPEWSVMLAEMRRHLLHLIGEEGDVKSFILIGDRPRRELYVGGADRVSEGEQEMDFDIPEASIIDQVEEEIEYISREFCELLRRSS